MNNIKQGYKQTEFGVIPEDWEVKPLYDCCSKITDGTHDTPKQVDFGIPYITAIHVKEIGIDFNNCYFLPESVHRIIYNRCNPELDDILMVNIGAGVGTTALVNVGYEFSLKNVALLKPNKSHLIGSFLNYWQIFSKSNILQTVMTGGAQPFLSLNQIGSLKIALPTITEQTAIATALSDTDELIAALDKKIAKKQQMKQGAMQQLLTGKKRLSGFSGEWVEKKLGDDFEVYAGGDVQNGYYNDIYTQDHKYPIYSNSLIKKGLYGYTSQPRYSGNSITITGRGTVGHAEYRDTQFDAIVRLLVLKPKSNLCCSLITEIINFTVSFQTESTGVPQLTAPQVYNTEIYYPKSIDEQTAIAQILTDMDNEIAQLEKERDKYKELKAGMMQVLLTGKVRLV
jgi:type I restriction enzyme, S subunit